jgi:hypothetical protein
MYFGVKGPGINLPAVTVPELAGEAIESVVYFGCIVPGLLFGALVPSLGYG